VQNDILIFGLGVLSVFLLALLLWHLKKSREHKIEKRRLLNGKMEVENNLDLILNHTSDFAYRHDFNGHFTYVSSNVKRVLGYDPEVETLRYSQIFTDNPLNKAAVKIIKSAIEKGTKLIEPHFVEVKAKRGELHMLEVFEKIESDATGKILSVSGVARDVTSIYKAELELKESERQQSLILNAIPDLMFTHDKKGVFLEYQFSGPNDFFMTPENFIGKKINDVFPDPLNIKLTESLSEAYATGEVQTVEYRMEVHKEIKFYEARFVKLADDRVLNMARDITAQKKLEEGLRESKEAAEAATEAKSNFLATMSHEIRTPMNGVIGMTSLLADTALDEEQKDYVDTIKASGDTLLRVINDILDFSRIESGKISLEDHVFGLKKMIEESMGLVSYEAEKKEVGLSLIVENDVPEIVLTDRARLRQILLNLLSNAVKFTDAGFVHIKVSIEDNKKNTATLKFAIKDTGIGIPSKKLRGLFAEFTQADSSHSRKYGGTGLGLAICKNLVTLLKGQIWVESKWKEGSTFFFTIKVKKVIGANKSVLDHVPTIDVNNEDPLSLVISNSYPLKILLAEDNSVNLKLTMIVLERMGFVPDVAKTGREVITLVKRNEYDVILMDVQMPEMDGIQATELIREMQFKKEPCIIGISANAFDEDVKRAKDSGMEDYIVKPMNFEELRKKLVQVGQRNFPFVS